MDLLARIDRWGKETPEKVAHVCGTRRLTYGELLLRSDALAGYLVGTLSDDHSPIAVLGHKEPELLIAFLACVKWAPLCPHRLVAADATDRANHCHRKNVTHAHARAHRRKSQRS